MRGINGFFKYFVFFAVSLVILLPFFWTVYAALIKNDLDIGTPLLKSGKYGLDNFKYILTKGNMLIWFKNSIFVVGIITAANLMINSMAGYALARFDFKGKKAFFLYITGIMMIPAQVLIVPIFLVISRMALINTYPALIIPFVFNPFGVFLMRQHFLGFPKEIEEAASIDGLSVYSLFYKIALPLAKNALMTQAILIFVWNWNSFMLPSILVNNPMKFTLPLGMYQITNTQYVTSVTKAMAGATLTLLPTIIFFLFFQKKLMNSDMGAAIKG
jgi:multiple sugar transport system permease protein